KEHADSLGKGTSVPMDDWIDITVERWPTFGKDKALNDVPLAKQRVRLHTGSNRVVFTVDGKPAAVKIDPDNLFFDRHPDDNRMRVELGGAFGNDKALTEVPLAKQRVRLHTGSNRVGFTVDGKPGAVKMEPDNLFFDRHPEDNRKRVAWGEGQWAPSRTRRSDMGPA